MLSPNLWMSEGRRPSHIRLGMVRLWASNDMDCGNTRAHTNTNTAAHIHREETALCVQFIVKKNNMSAETQLYFKRFHTTISEDVMIRHRSKILQ